MHRCLLILLACTLATTGLAIPPALPPKAPEVGQAFDDREIIAHMEMEGRKLLRAGRIKPLRSAPRKCSLNLPSSPSTQRPPLTEIARSAEVATVVLGEFYREGKKSAVKFSSAAGGFFVGQNGVVLTSMHVVSEKDSQGFIALTRDGQVFPVRSALAADPIDDLVILQLDVPDDATFPTLPLASDLPPIGTSVSVLSHPDEHFWLLTTGVVSRHIIWKADRGDEHYTCITADFAKGSSGCPVLDDHGNVVAVVNNTQSVYYDDDGRKKQLDLQMVVKNATPSWCARNLFEAPLHE